MPIEEDHKNKYFLGIEIEINHHCNLSCIYCPNSNSKRTSQGTMTLANFLIIMNQLRDINYEGKISYHFYSEPLLHTELEIFIQASKKILPKTRSEIFSNGVFLNEQKYFSLRSAGVDKFTITKHKGFGTVAFDETYKNLSEEEKCYVKFIDYSQLTYSNRGGLVDCGKKIDEPLKRICLVPTSSVVVTVNGNVITCFEDYLERKIMGNVFQEHIKDIWEKPEYFQFRTDLKLGLRHKYEVCKSCNNIQVI